MGFDISNIKASYDFIVCGGGTSGCVVAGRLAEDENVSVLVLEAGPDSKDMENVHMPGGWSALFDKETDWNVISTKGSGINDRQVKLSRGKFLGGSSGCNATLVIRGSKQDYDDWGVPGWSGDEFFEYMKKAESFISKPWFKHSDDHHGYNGHLGVMPHDLAPISNMIIDSFEDKGLKLDHDMFSHGDNPHGCGHAPRTVTNGLRTTSADFVTKKNEKNNIDIICNVHVDKVILEDNEGQLCAVGVKAVLGDGTVIQIDASKEIIVSGGAYCSPNILNRSGIGAKADLEKHGIKTLVDNPNVGQNLMDHLVVYMFYETDKEGITTDHLAHHANALATSYELWKNEKKGFMSAFPFGAVAFARLDDRLADSEIWQKAKREEGRDPMGLTPKQPNVELLSVECYGGPKQYDQFPVDGKHAFVMIPELFGQRSRGSVTLKDADPRAIPVVDCGYLTDPLDLEVLAEACRFSNEIIMEGKGTKDIVKGTWPPHAVEHHKYKTREDWYSFVKENATTCYHASGTCAMGTASDPKAVVDQDLFVKGVRGLRVADCSIMPILHGGHTQMPAYGIGEKAADLIKTTWGTK